MTHTCDQRCFLPADATPAERQDHEAFAEAWDDAEVKWDALEPEERARRLADALPGVLADMAGKRTGSAFLHDIEDRPWWQP